MDEIMGKRNFCTSWWLIFATMMCILISSLFSGGVFSQNNYYIFAFLSEATVVIPAGIGFILTAAKGEIRNLGFNAFPVRLLPIVIVMPLAAQPFINTVTLPANLAANFMFDIGADASLPVPSNPLNFVFGILTLCVAAPILEEFLCRGLIMNYLKNYGIIVSLGVSSLAFALLHFDPSVFIVIFFLGLLFGVMRVLTDSLWVCIIAHSANNILAFAQQFMPGFSNALSIVEVIVSLILFPLLLCLFLYLVPKENREKIQYVPLAKPGISVGAILCFSVYGIYAVLLFIMKMSTLITGVSYIL